MSNTTINVLLVEDDDVDAEAVQRAFQQNRIANPITVAQDGLVALALLRGENGNPPFPRPNVILLDLNMPRMGGIEFLEEIRNDTRLKDSIVFVLTTSEAEVDKVAAYDQCVAGYMVKSRVGEDFLRLTEMLECYWRVIELPD